MNAKNLKYMQLFESLVGTDYTANKDHTVKSMKKFMELDYALAIEVWDYITTTKEALILKDDNFNAIACTDILKVMYDKASTKCIKAVTDTISIRKAVYQYSISAVSGYAFDMLANLVVANKLTQAEEILRMLSKNEKCQKQFGAMMKKLLEHIFVELLKKNPSKIDMPKKLCTLLLSYVRKIKTDEKALLEQRIKETQ